MAEIEDEEDRPFVSKYAHNPRSFSLHSAAMAGYLDRIKYLVESEDADVNQKDRHQAIPLFYACLGGHRDVVLYLLDRGAVLERGKYETERCYYAALNEEIVELLDRYKANPNKNNAFIDMMTRLLAKGQRADFKFVDAAGQSFAAHKFVLAARSSYLHNIIKSGASSLILAEVGLKSLVAAKAVVEYMYTSSVNVDFDEYENLIRTSQKFELKELVFAAREEYKRRETVRLVINSFDVEGLQSSFAKIIHRDSVSNADLNAIDVPESAKATSSDLVLILKPTGDDPNYHRFFVHKATLAEESDYFKAMFSSSFKEATHQADIHPILLTEEIDPSIFGILVDFVYSFILPKIETEEELIEILNISNLYLMNDLKFAAVRQLLAFVTNENCFNLLKAGEFYKSQRLYQYCLDYVEERFADFYGTEALEEYIQSGGMAAKHFNVVREEYVEENIS